MLLVLDKDIFKIINMYNNKVTLSAKYKYLVLLKN